MYQCSCCQKLLKAIFHVFYFHVIYFTAYGFQNAQIHFISKLFITGFLIFETLSWAITHNGICPQVLISLLDYRYIYILMVRPGFLIEGLILFIVVVILCKIPGYFLKGGQLYFNDYSIINITMLFTLSFIFAIDIKRGLYIFSENYFTIPDNPQIIPYFQQTDVTVKKPKKPLKNLIMLHIECAEKRSLGLFNRHYPDLMPFLSGIAANGTLLTNVNIRSDQMFTISSIFTQHSGLPMLGNSFKDRGSLLLSKRVHTVSDFLHKLGYELIASCTGYFSQYKFYKLHSMKVFDSIFHKKKHDYAHYEFLFNNLMPELKKKGKPFFLVIHNENTHPEFHVEKECFDVFPDKVKKWPVALQSLQCFDWILKKFFKRFHELGFQNNTEVYIYGDHLLWGSHNFYDKPRQMLMVFPLKEKKIVDKPISLFDVAPSLLSLLGIDEYSPKFPFGFDFFGPNVSRIPTTNDRKYINNFANSIDN